MVLHGEVRRAEGGAACGEVGRAAADDMPAGGQRASDQRRIRQLADPNRKVVALTHEIDPAVVQVHVDIDMGVSAQKLRDSRR